MLLCSLTTSSNHHDIDMVFLIKYYTHSSFNYKLPQFPPKNKLKLDMIAIHVNVLFSNAYLQQQQLNCTLTSRIPLLSAFFFQHEALIKFSPHKDFPGRKLIAQIIFHKQQQHKLK